MKQSHYYGNAALGTNAKLSAIIGHRTFQANNVVHTISNLFIRLFYFIVETSSTLVK